MAVPVPQGYLEAVVNAATRGPLADAAAFYFKGNRGECRRQRKTSAIMVLQEVVDRMETSGFGAVPRVGQLHRLIWDEGAGWPMHSLKASNSFHLRSTLRSSVWTARNAPDVEESMAEAFHRFLLAITMDLASLDEEDRGTQQAGELLFMATVRDVSCGECSASERGSVSSALAEIHINAADSASLDS